MGQQKTRNHHKYSVNTARGDAEVIRPPFNLRRTLEKDELNLDGAAGGWIPSGKVGVRCTGVTVVAIMRIVFHKRGQAKRKVPQVPRFIR